MTTIAPGVPTTNIDFQEPAFVLDPYPQLHEIHRLGPVVWHEGLQQYLITGWRDVARVFGNAASFASDYEFVVGLFGGATMMCMDEKQRHDQVRGIWAQDFLRPNVEKQREMVTQVIEARTASFLERVKSGETVDAVGQMTRGIPTLVIANMLGIPSADFEDFSRWSDAMGAIPEGTTDLSPRGAELVAAGRQATRNLNDYLEGEIEDRKVHPRDDLIGRMVESEVVGTMTDREMIGSNTQLVFAGNETTASLMAHTLVALAAHPEQRRLLVEDRSLIPQAIEEIHRWNSIVHVNWRFARGEGVEIAGVPVEDGAVIMNLQGVANRDPDRWERPDELDILRDKKQHLGFGFGMHSCLGLNLARLELGIWLNRMLDEIPDWQVADMDWGTNWVLRGPIRVDVSAP